MTLASKLRRVGDKSPVMSSVTYTGTGVARSVVNGLDMTKEGVLISAETGTIEPKYLFLTQETVGLGYMLTRNAVRNTFLNAITSWNADGYSINANETNDSTIPYVSYGFLAAPNFLEIKSWAGDGTASRVIPHGLGVIPGMILIKAVNDTQNWIAIVPGLAINQFITFNDNNGPETNANIVAALPTTTGFTIGDRQEVNAIGTNYIALVFGNDPAADGLIKCGSYTGNGTTTGPVITLGWEPQFVMVKRHNNAEWALYDSTRNASNPRTRVLLPGKEGTEITSGSDVDFLSTGFQPKTSQLTVNKGGDTYYYMAINAEAAP